VAGIDCSWDWLFKGSVGAAVDAEIDLARLAVPTLRNKYILGDDIMDILKGIIGILAGAGLFILGPLAAAFMFPIYLLLQLFGITIR